LVTGESALLYGNRGVARKSYNFNIALGARITVPEINVLQFVADGHASAPLNFPVP
jgi:hypothetical protein